MRQYFGDRKAKIEISIRRNLFDRITFNAPNQGIDKINDFIVLDDTIAVSAVGFGGGLVANQAITASTGLLMTNSDIFAIA